MTLLDRLFRRLARRAPPPPNAATLAIERGRDASRRGRAAGPVGLRWSGVVSYASVACVLAVALPLAARADAPLTLDEAVALAMRQSKGTQLSRLKSDAADASAALARRQRYPRVEAFGLSGYYFRPLDLQLKQGALSPLLDNAGNVLGLGALSKTLGPFPATDLTLVKGDRIESIGGITVLQPLSQLWQIDSGVRAARADATAAQREAERINAQIRMGIEELFAGILVEEARAAHQQARVAYAERQLRDAENARKFGELLDDAVLGLRAALVEAKTDLMRSQQQRARLTLQLGDLIGRPGVEQIALAASLPERADHPLEYWLARAARNPDRQVADATAEKARAGSRAARQAYIPEVSAFATGYVQDGLPLLPTRGSAVGLTLRWDIFDFGRRRAELAKSVSQQRAAELDRDRLEEEASRQIRVAYQDVTHATELIDLAEQAVAFRRRAAELARQGFSRGIQLESKALGAEADLRKAEADLLGARLQRRLALVKLYFLVGE